VSSSSEVEVSDPFDGSTTTQMVASVMTISPKGP
jgi:hypothetical protein